jgi:DivIVA domain-containing protein
MPTDPLRTRHVDVPEMSADTIEGRRFAQSWRGYDPEEVKQFLGQVAEQVRVLRGRYESTESARREAEERAAHPQMDEATLMSAVGEETAGILRSAHSAAAEISAKAEVNAQTVLATAQAKANELIAQAESLLATRTTEAEAVAADIRESALADAQQLREAAQQDADSIAAAAGRDYQETVQAAQALREKILTDLARRRKLGSVQVEQLRAGRERLIDAYLVVRHTLDQVTDELQRADAEARAAADAVGRQNAVERPDEPVDLRHDDTWDPLTAFSDPKSPAEAKPLPTASTGVGELTVMAPKATEVASAAGGGASGTGPTVLGPPVLGPPVAIPVPSVMGTPATVNLPPAPPAPTAHERPTTEGPKLKGNSTGQSQAIVAPEDAIESVRVLRQDNPPSPPEATGPGTPPVAGKAGADEGAAPDAPAGAEATGPHDVEGLFARIRASRAEATTTARKTLDQQDGPVPSGSDVTGKEAGGGGAAGDATTTSALPDEVAAVDQPAEVPAVGAEDNGHGPSPEETNADQEFFRRRDAITSRLEASLARKLKRALQDEQNSLLDRLRNLKVPATPANILPNIEEHPDRFVEAGRPLLEEAARAGANLVAALWGGTVPPDLALEGLDDLAEDLGRAIAEPLRQRLELAFQSLDEDNGEVADALGAAYREWKTQRIEAAAHDEVAAAFSRGSYLAFANGTPLRWVADASDAPCPDCEDNALAGEQVKSEPWPTGQLYPPAHPGCRCALAPDKAPIVKRSRRAGGGALPSSSEAVAS